MFRSISRQFNASGLAAIVLLILGLLVAWGGYNLLYDDLNIEQVASDFYANSAAELGSIAITVLVIETLNARRAFRREKADLILEMGSPENTVVREAVRKLRIRGWLQDGSLKRANLAEANLQGVNLGTLNTQKPVVLQQATLMKADLRDTYFHNTSLEEAYLLYADLQGADFRNANLKSVNLEDTNLQGVKFSETDFNEKTRLPDDDLNGERSFWTQETKMARFTDPNYSDPENPDPKKRVFWRSDNPESPAYRGDQP